MEISVKNVCLTEQDDRFTGMG